MYQYSRAIFMAVRDRVVPDAANTTPEDARRTVLAFCEGTVERIAEDPRYFARPASALFTDIRPYFAIRDQAVVRAAVDRGVGLALAHVRREMARHPEEVGCCRAVTRRGERCRRTPLPGVGYCPSHRHLRDADESRRRVLALA